MKVFFRDDFAALFTQMAVEFTKTKIGGNALEVC